MLHTLTVTKQDGTFAQYICYLQLPYTQKHTYTVIRFFLQIKIKMLKGVVLRVKLIQNSWVKQRKSINRQLKRIKQKVRTDSVASASRWSASEDQTSKLLKTVNSKTEAELRNKMTGNGKKLEHKSHKKSRQNQKACMRLKHKAILGDCERGPCNRGHK